ncbi:MAG: acyl carrier protein [Planctomycetota bacterium]
MDQATIRSDIQRVLAETLGVDQSAITPDADSASIEGWDSVNHLNIVLALETTFGVSFEPEEIEAMASVAGVERVVAAKLGAI